MTRGPAVLATTLALAMVNAGLAILIVAAIGVRGFAPPWVGVVLLLVLEGRDQVRKHDQEVVRGIGEHGIRLFRATGGPFRGNRIGFRLALPSAHSSFQRVDLSLHLPRDLPGPLQEALELVPDRHAV